MKTISKKWTDHTAVSATATQARIDEITISFEGHFVVSNEKHQTTLKISVLFMFYFYNFLYETVVNP